MSEEEPGGITERFRAFAQAEDPPAARNPRTLLLAAAAVLIIALVVVWIAV